MNGGGVILDENGATGNRYKGIIAAAIAFVLWSTGGIFIKLIDWNPVAISGSRSLIAAMVLLIYVRKPKITKSKPMILGAIAYAATVMCFVLANKLTTSANAILLQYTAPIFVAVLGVWILKEKIQWYDLVSIVVVFLGMILFFIDNVSAGSAIGNIIAIFSGFTLASTTIALKLLKDGSGVETTILGNIITFIVALPFIFTSLPDIKSIIIIVVMGIFQLGISYIFYINAIKYVTALEAILITVVEPLLNPIWVFVFTGEKPGIFAVFGGIVVILAVILRSIYVTKKMNLEREE